MTDIQTKKSRHKIEGTCDSIADFCRKTGARREVISRRLKKFGITLDEYVKDVRRQMENAIGGVIGANTAILTMHFGFGSVMLVKGRAGLQICTTRRSLDQIKGVVTAHEVWQRICQVLARQGYDPFAVHDEMCAMYIKSVTANNGIVEYDAVHI